jgi:hypothetical protein
VSTKKENEIEIFFRMTVENELHHSKSKNDSHFFKNLITFDFELELEPDAQIKAVIVFVDIFRKQALNHFCFLINHLS